MSRETLRARNTREPSCRKCLRLRSDVTHRPAARWCAETDEHHTYDGPASAVWLKDIDALLAYVDAAESWREAVTKALEEGKWNDPTSASLWAEVETRGLELDAAKAVLEALP